MELPNVLTQCMCAIEQAKQIFIVFRVCFKSFITKMRDQQPVHFLEYFYIFFLKTVKVFLINISHKIVCYKGAIYFTLGNAGCSRVTLNKI